MRHAANLTVALAVCASPSVPRVVMQPISAPSIFSSLVCPATGVCGYEPSPTFDADMAARVVCLTEFENNEAIRRGHVAPP